MDLWVDEVLKALDQATQGDGLSHAPLSEVKRLNLFPASSAVVSQQSLAKFEDGLVERFAYRFEDLRWLIGFTKKFWPDALVGMMVLAAARLVLYDPVTKKFNEPDDADRRELIDLLDGHESGTLLWIHGHGKRIAEMSSWLLETVTVLSSDCL